MASGKQHTRASVIASVVSPTFYIIIGGDFLGAILLSVGCLLGTVLTPDLDSDNGSISNYHIRRIGKIPERIWYYYWKPYNSAFQHRAWITHYPIVSTVFRLAYILWIFWIGFGLFLIPVQLFLGLLISDIIHFVMDFKIFSGVFKWMQ